MILSPRNFLRFRLAGAAPILAFGLAAHVSALQFRSYQQSHDDWLYNNPSHPSPNATFVPSAALFRGVGSPSADPVEWFRHMALISPRHFVYATHYPISNAWQIEFLGSDGALHGYGITGNQPVTNSQGQNTDLLLGTLASDVDPGTGITPFPVLNLPGEANYTALPLLVFGKAARAGTMAINGFTTLSNDPGFDTTRYAYFDYNTASGGPNDCNFEGGDSGCPAFVMVGGLPALIGTNSGQDDLPNNISRNYSNFIPAYLDRLDTLMEAQGYHVRRVYPAATTVSTTAAAPAMLKQTKAGSVTISAQNSGAAPAHNVAMQITFSSPPSTVGGDGWICQAVSSTVWKCHRGGITNASGAPISASWPALPVAGSLQISVDRSFDGATVATTSTTLPIQETYAGWSGGLADPRPDADPDGDGISNLIEYAFGGAASVNSASSPDGRPLLPVSQASGGNFLVRFPRRTDAAARGLSYIIEFSSDCHDWSAAFPAGTTLNAAPYSPVSPGFELATLTVPKTALRRFVRVRVVLAE